jgi:hypothetical protein
MRKIVDWTVYPASRTESQDDPTMFVQSDKRALSINLRTKKGMLSNGKGHPSFMSTQKILGAIEVDVPDEIIEMCQEAQAKKGDRIGPGVFVG